MALQVLAVKVPRESENTPEQMAQLLTSLARATSNPSFIHKLFGKTTLHISLEVTLINGLVIFTIVYPQELDTFVQSQVLATYQDVVMTPIKDYLSDWASTPPHVSLIKQAYAAYFVALLLVAGLSFYVGSLRPKKPLGMGPPPIAVPRN